MHRISFWVAAAFVAGSCAFAAGEEDEPSPPAAEERKGDPPSTEQRKGDPKKDEDKLLQMKYPRQPAGILRAMAAQLEGYPGVKDSLERLGLDVTAGNWPGVKAFLNTLPAERATKAYNVLLKSLLEDNATLLPADVLRVAELRPDELTPDQLRSVGALLQRALSIVDASGSLVAELKAGTEKFGADDAKKRTRTANLLLAADRIIEAGSFLPPLQDAINTHNVPDILLHVRFKSALGQSRKDEALIQEAWQLIQGTLKFPGLKHEDELAALNEALQLLPLIPKDAASAWLRKLFASRRDLGMHALSHAAETAEAARPSREREVRVNALALNKWVVEELLKSAGGNAGSWAPTLNMLALSWLTESEQTVSERSDNNHPYLPADEILPLAPGPEWLAALDSSLAQRLRFMMGQFVVRGGDNDRALKLIEDLAKSEPDQAGKLAAELLNRWTNGANNELRRYDYNRRRNYNYDYDNDRGIPLTRARQGRSIKQLAEGISRLRKLPIKQPDPAAIVNAFAASHSAAEVFREDDIRTVFGIPEALPPQTLATLVGMMRQHLAGRWRKQETQDEAQTHRTDQEMVDEVKRGYALAVNLLEQARKKIPNNWQLSLGLATVRFDEAEFLYGQKADLATYTRHRDASFKMNELACTQYAQQVESMDPAAWTAAPYIQWFFAALGASDLSVLTRQDMADAAQIEKIKTAIRALPGELAGKHLELFGAELSSAAGNISAELKPRFLREALTVLGDHPGGEQARKLLEIYKELLGEVDCELAIDGDKAVGTRPFGARLSLRYTAQLGREGSGFSKYLQNNYNMGSNNRYHVNYRNDIEKNIREALTPGFVIESIKFAEPDVTPRGFGRPGWMETTLACLVLKAKDPAIDRVPPIQIDLDFHDGIGVVVLPIVSPVTLIEARRTPAARPFTDVEITETLDERELAAGKLRMEVRAAGKGIAPDLGELLDLEALTRRGFKTAGVQDSGLAVSALDASGETIRPVSDRTWTIELQADAAAAPTFDFPTSKMAGAKLKLQRYSEGDISEAASSVPLKLPGRGLTNTVAIAAAAAVLLALALFLLLRRGGKQAPAASRYTRPSQATVFNVLSLLQQIQSDPALNLSHEQRSELGASIRALEEHYFARNAAAGKPDLETVLQRWCAVVNATGARLSVRTST